MMDAILQFVESTTKVLLHGPFGAGKTTLALARINWLLRRERVRGDDILVLTPQRTLAEPYRQALLGGELPTAGPPVVMTTFASLAQQAVERYWPLIAGDAGFTEPSREPNFLTLETSQYHMARLVDQAIDEGAFDALRLERNRVVSQVLDNLNKAALLRMDIDTVYRRLELAAPFSEQRAARLNALRAAQRLSHAFRALCLAENLLDFSLQVEVFNRQVLHHPWSRTHLFRSHRHIIFDNAEEDTPSAHRLVLEWLPQLASGLIIVDDDAGYRSFLGADPRGVAALATACAERIHLNRSWVMPVAIRQLAHQTEWLLSKPKPRHNGGLGDGALPDTVTVQGESDPEPETAPPGIYAPSDNFRFYPQMIRWVANEINRLVQEEGTPPGEIVVMAPFVSDALRFSLQHALSLHNIEVATHRPSRALEAEPAARTLLALAKLAHPHWRLEPAAPDVAHMLAVAIPRLDPLRANVLADIVYQPRRRGFELSPFAALADPARTRITYAAGEEYDQLRSWLAGYRASGEDAPLDQFFARVFGELLSQPGYGFHADRDAARVASQLVESARKFRWALEDVAEYLPEQDPLPGDQPLLQKPTTKEIGREYLRLAESGALSALYVPGWRVPEDAVFLAPAYTFLLRNRAVDVQFWLDIGANGWWERLYQPLTHPYVLSPHWPETDQWTDKNEYETSQDTLRRLLLGLFRRTRREIYVAVSEFSESGSEQHGRLLSIVNRLLAER